jgi:hypothetical protein
VAALPGVSQEVTVGATVLLDGSASSANRYCWAMTVIPDGYTGMLADALTATPSFVANMIGDYVLTLATDVGIFNSLGVRVIPA